MTRQRDTQRSKLYAAERAVPGFETDDRLETVADLEAYVSDICNSKWFRAHWPRIKRIAVHDGRRHRRAVAYDSRGGGYWGDMVNTISMPRWSRSRMIVLHEIAHLCVPWMRAAHGWEFADAYLRLVRHFLGQLKHDQLRDAFRRHRVRYAPKRKGTSKGNPAALAAWRARKAAEGLNAQT